jgi:DNA-binding NarL/FixJ family response regulator
VIGEARDGIETIEKATTLRPDLVLLDLGMPRLNASTESKQLKRSDKRVPNPDSFF